MVHVFDANKKLLLVCDVYPASVSVKKGDYTIVAVIRHDNTEVLKQFEHLPLIVEKQLEKTISVPIYRTHLESARGGKKGKSMDLYKGQMITLVAGPLTESLPKDCAPGKSVPVGAKLSMVCLRDGDAWYRDIGPNKSANSCAFSDNCNVSRPADEKFYGCQQCHIG